MLLYSYYISIMFYHLVLQMPVLLQTDSHRHLWRFSTAWYGTVRFGTARYGTAQFGSVAFPPQFSTAIEWAGLFTHRYNCAASTAVTSS